MFLIVSFTIFSFFLFFIFTLFHLIFHQKLRYCNCEICHAYLTSSWRNDFINLSDWYAHLLRRSPTSTIKLHVLNNVITANPANVEHILKTHFHNYPKGKQFSVILGDLLGRGIFNSDGDTWRFQRKLASLELGSVSVRVFAHEIVKTEIQTRLLPILTSFSSLPHSVLDLQDVFRRFSFDTISKLSFGFDPDCLRLPFPTSEFAVAFDTASTLSAKRALAPFPLLWKIKRFFRIGSEKKLKESIHVINRLAADLINQRRRTGLTVKNNDLISRFMAVVAEDDDEYLRDIVVSFLLAGRDTVAAGLTGFFWLLTRNSKVENRIREELDRVMGPGSDSVTASCDEMRDMNYLHAALYESMRLYPPVQFDSKFAEHDDVLSDGTCLTRGTKVTYHPYAMGRMSRIWGPDYEDFKPERWLDNGKFRPENPVKYPVFQAGARVCVGKELAIMEMKSIAVAIIRRFQLRVADDGSTEKLRFAPGLTTTVNGGLPVTIQERSLRSV